MVAHPPPFFSLFARARLRPPTLPPGRPGSTPVRRPALPPHDRLEVGRTSKNCANLEQVLELLLEQAGSEEDSARNIVSECLGKLAIAQPVVLDDIEKLPTSRSSMSDKERATAATAFKHAVSSKHTTAEEDLAKHLSCRRHRRERDRMSALSRTMSGPCPADMARPTLPPLRTALAAVPTSGSTTARGRCRPATLLR